MLVYLHTYLSFVCVTFSVIDMFVKRNIFMKCKKARKDTPRSLKYIAGRDKEFKWGEREYLNYQYRFKK